ncbi:BRCA1-associated RING domain protein 1-like [Oscarella lobularis]|uniref:BRCA1-associated RING domain protein 1-like n=1 Tax=Oscarella lobularis TaxID=121494 RepID=UPI0033134B74
MEIDWFSTRDALKQLEQLLKCQICDHSFRDPVTVESCDHHFCRDCAERVIKGASSSCPQCSKPIWMRDLKANRAFANTLSALNRLRPLVGMGPRPESDRSLSKETGSLSKTSKNIFKIPAPPKRETVRDAVVINDDENIDNETENIGNTTRRTGQRNAPRRWSYPYPSTYVPEEKRNSATRKRRSDEGAASSRRGNKKKETISKDLDEEKLREKPSRRSEKKNGVSKKKNSKGETPLHVATIKGDLGEVTSLLTLGADPNSKDNAGWTPLHEASNHGFYSIAEVLIDFGAVVNMPGMDNLTPLHDAVANGHTDLVKLLICKGASMTAKDAQGLMPINFAVSADMRKMLDAGKSPQIAVPADSPCLPSPKASPKSAQPLSSIVLLSTSLDDRQKDRVKQLTRQQKALTVDSFRSFVTHLVTNCDDDYHCPRTLKYLQALAAGKWIVRFQWVIDSLEKGTWQDEEHYEVRDAVGVRHATAPARSRHNAANKLPPLFDGCRFYLHGDFLRPMPKRDDLATLIRLAGGRLLVREPKSGDDNSALEVSVPYHSPESDFSWVLIIYDPKSERQRSVANGRFHFPAVPVTWLLDCLTKFKLEEPVVQ